jgi:hypothetical protein
MVQWKRLAGSAMALLVAMVMVVVAGATPGWAIIGGTPQQASDFPFFVRLTIDTDDPEQFLLCGGTVIAPDVVLTAAHCVDDGPQFDASMVDAHIAESVLRQPRQVDLHPLWNGHAADGHDLALLFFAQGATTGFTPVQVGAPFDRLAYSPGDAAVILGEGITSWNGQPTIPTIMGVDVVVHSDDYMDDIYNPWWGYDYWNEPLVIGAGSTYQTACRGDSGGPLLVRPLDRWIQVGVFSYTKEYCDVPGGFMELDNAQLAWIVSQVPAVPAGWGRCPLPDGRLGDPVVRYSNSPLPNAGRDGPNYWQLFCQPPPDPVLVVVPDVRGLTVAEARPVLLGIGLVVGTVSGVVDNSCNRLGQVISQSPVAGSTVPVGVEVSLRVGTRPPPPRSCP